VNVVTYPEQCIASGQCVVTSHGVFDQDAEDGTVVLLAKVPPADQEENVRRAVRLCPSAAIEIEE
jgi:ferredoxin